MDPHLAHDVKGFHRVHLGEASSLFFMLEIFPFYTPVGYLVLAKSIYINCLVSMFHKAMLCDLVELDMFDFDVTLVMD